MPGFKDYFSSASDRYRQFRPTYPVSLFEFLAAAAPSIDRAWDCGCGSGQASVMLAKFFTRVTASDASAAQIEQATPAANVRYVVSRAEQIAAEDGSIDVVTVAQAFHWLDQAEFFGEVTRVLKPGGLLAVWVYGLMSVNPEFDAVLTTFYRDVVGPYWPPERTLVESGYAEVKFPFAAIATPPFWMQAEWDFDHLLGYMNTWSAVKQYEKKHGSNPVELERKNFLTAWGKGDTMQPIKWPLSLTVVRKP